MTLSDPILKAIGREYTLGIPNAVILILVLAVIFSLIAKYTTFGRRIYVIGGNQQAAWLSGIAVGKNLTLMFVLNGLLCGVCSLVYCSQLGAARPQNAGRMCVDWEFNYSLSLNCPSIILKNFSAGLEKI